ncbi:MAG: dTMP kinase [Gammaproteobacteria bacterium RIFCSPLOWO2_02_FULL_42_14]|nr:MAG: dTMP kinase [Gammaproteobacteria bacterium RIFCSPHIGHO2_02_FULL_42_43]OGT27853.1 MAG: dTMP kinase [Gammaproteobacteria bacterium RIFCSPHIGHO2_01_FULL_42_8]OGT51151.1 MAG: dTMP kinase [Gammaproteobacteria bacterium RIFCSPHIGHO2_12_FULL_41_25]OGT62913.1 MAG: dTMP kinase [Gammaproteobacteria bacterium RIFCSPLOWO2_02_FULL_42_14]OGT86044.1 MAG: dTMP kinase [Gammaproteobacteria bacterium RIFCSPLOWO2_12_FULL_42_18]
MKKFYFITLEGGEGAGKSTALLYIADFLRQAQLDFILTREPGGTAIGEAIRHILLQQDNTVMSPDTELLLMFAARAQHIAEVIKPALDSGKTVISDRFTDASFAYQGGGRGIDPQRLQMLSDWIQGDLTPDLTLLLDAPIEIGLKRIHERGKKDRIEHENVAFFERVRQVYLDRAKKNPKRFVVIRADQALEKVKSDIHMALSKIINQK